MLQDFQISNFTAGELSPRLKGRTDYAKYYSGLDTCRNMVVMPQGGATKRPGTNFVALALDQSPSPFSVRTKPFVFSTLQAYVLELGPGYARIYADDAPVVSGGSPVQIATPYLVGDLAAIHVTQSADTLFLACGTGGPDGFGYPLATITRTSQTSWHYQQYALSDGPYLSLNTVPATTLQPVAGIVLTDVSGAADNGSGNVRLTVGATGSLVNGPATIAKVGGTTEANGQQVITIIDATHVDLDGVPFQDAYTSGGRLYQVPSGVVTLQANQIAGINNGVGFQPSDVGRQIRFQSTDGTTTGWIWGTIATYESQLDITVTLGAQTITSQAQPQGLGASSGWQLGAFGAAQGYPYVVGFWQQRLTLFGNATVPNAVWLSNTAAFDVFATTLADGTVTAACGLYWVVDTTSSNGQVNIARWISMAGSAEALQLGLGTAGSEAILAAASTSAPLSSTNVQVYQETAYGSAANVDVLRIGKAILFADIPARKIREWMYYWQAFGYLGPDKTAESEHITRGAPGSPPASWGIRWMCYQQSPHQVVWAGRNDGGLISITYDHDQDIWAPAQHTLGGQYYGAAPIVESGCTIPSPDGTYDELWLVVLRTINGVPTRFIEVMTRYFDALPPENAWFTDCALASALTFPAASLNAIQGLTPTPPLAGTAAMTMPPQFTGSGTFIASGPVFTGTSADVGLVLRANGGRAVVTAPVSTTTVTAKVIVPLNSESPVAQGAWSATRPVTSFAGMQYAAGETVRVLGDGADFGSQIVPASGTLTLPAAASFAIAGFPYAPILVSEPFESQRAALAASRGKAKRLDHLYLRFYETLGAIFGRRYTDPRTGELTDYAETLQFRLPLTSFMGWAPPLYTGIKRLDERGGYDLEGQVIVTQDAPLPLTVLAISASVDVGDMPPQSMAA